jgi:hypothetical protein
VDVFGHNPYPDSAAEAPSARHADPGTIGEGDLDRLLGALADGFGGTAQPLPGGGHPSVWYMEDGFQTAVPSAKRHGYQGTENDPTARTPSFQAAQLRAALELAYCQPEVGAFFNFELRDESRLGGWQSGLLWSDGTAKPSYAPVRETIAAIHARQVSCG